MIDLEPLPTEELRRLSSAIAEELASRARNVQTDDLDSLARLWHEPITDVGGAMAFQVWVRGPGKHARKHLAAAETLVPSFYKDGRSRPEERYFARKLSVLCLSNYLKSINVHPSTATLSKNLGSIAAAVDHELPHYRVRGLLPHALNQMVTRR